MDYRSVCDMIYSPEYVFMMCICIVKQRINDHDGQDVHACLEDSSSALFYNKFLVLIFNLELTFS